MAYALLTPLILPVATVTFSVSYLCFRHLLSEACVIPTETLGEVYFRACFGLFWGIYAQQLTLLGLFLLKFNHNDQGHDLGQLCVSSLTFFITVQYHIWLYSRLHPRIRHQEGVVNHLNKQDDTSGHQQQHNADAAAAYHTDSPVELVDVVAGRVVVADRGSQTVWLHPDALNIGDLIERCVARDVLTDTVVRVRTASSHLCLQPGYEPALQGVTHI